jgi:Fe-S-cluster containining protein
MNNQWMATIIDWDLPLDAFKLQIHMFIKISQEEGKVLPLPIDIIPGENFMAQLAMLVSQVRCDNCNAICCKEDPLKEGIAVLDTDYELLKNAGHAQSVQRRGENWYLPCPCPLLKGDRCTTYGNRPFVCIAYPFQPGGHGNNGNPLLTVASSCPEGRRIVRDTYITLWKIRQRFQPLKKLYQEGKLKIDTVP